MYVCTYVRTLARKYACSSKFAGKHAGFYISRCLRMYRCIHVHTCALNRDTAYIQYVCMYMHMYMDMYVHMHTCCISDCMVSILYV